MDRNYGQLVDIPRRFTSSNRMMTVPSNYGDQDVEHHQTSELIATLHSSSMQRWNSLQDFVDSFGINSNLSELHSTFLPRSSGGGGDGSDSMATTISASSLGGGSERSLDGAFQRSTSITSLTSCTTGLSSSRGSNAPCPRAPPNSPATSHDSIAPVYQIAYAQRPPGMSVRPSNYEFDFEPHFGARNLSKRSLEEMLVSSTSGGGGGFGPGTRFGHSFGNFARQQTHHGAIGGHRTSASIPRRDGPPLPAIGFNTTPSQLIPSGGLGLSGPQSSIPPVHNRNYQEARYKTELCLHFREKNACPHGQHCLFAHGLNELRPYRGRHPKHKTQPCKSFHETGYCNYGYRCSYVHLESPRTIRYIKSLNDEAQKQRKFNKQQLVGHRQHYHRF